MKARELKRPNVGECQRTYDKYSIDGHWHNTITTDLCAVIQALERRIESKNSQTIDILNKINQYIEIIWEDICTQIAEKYNERQIAESDNKRLMLEQEISILNTQKKAIEKLKYKISKIQIL